ncbi:MAG TPA: dTDP-glucose 4,6-dehydratase [Fimbriimonadaceae bacterium]|nr:dTDP-glucose 4,6-dehydratase [Fimbriimonadaceae bacterium]
MNLLVTGGAGFIGSAFVRLVRKELPDAQISILDALTYAGNLSTLKDDLADSRVRFYPGKIQDPTVVEGIFKSDGITHVVNFAAESHNDRAMLEAGSFIQTDVYGVYVLLEAIRKFGAERFVHVSTDEVYGSIAQGEFTEQSPIEPNTPYSASKAGGELQIRAAVKAHGVPAVITRGGNTYGPYHFPEKLIPFFITRLIDGKKVPVYGDGSQVREWIHCEDHARGILHVLQHGKVGEAYNVGDQNERRNMEVVDILLAETDRDHSNVKTIPDPRRGAHDQRYSMSASKLRQLGWIPEKPFEASLKETVRWYKENQDWWRPLVQTDDYQRFIKAFYGPTLGEDL